MYTFHSARNEVKQLSNAELNNHHDKILSVYLFVYHVYLLNLLIQTSYVTILFCGSLIHFHGFHSRVISGEQQITQFINFNITNNDIQWNTAVALNSGHFKKHWSDLFCVLWSLTTDHNTIKIKRANVKMEGENLELLERVWCVTCDISFGHPGH